MPKQIIQTPTRWVTKEVAEHFRTTDRTILNWRNNGAAKSTRPVIRGNRKNPVPPRESSAPGDEENAWNLTNLMSNRNLSKNGTFAMGVHGAGKARKR